MPEKEYNQTEHRLRELIGMLIEDGADAVVVGWSKTVKNDTTVNHEAWGNHFAVRGLALETFRNLAASDEVLTEDSDEEE